MRWRKYIDFDVIHLLVGAIVGMGLSSCQPEMPVISTITVEADGLTVPVNPDLYGLTIEEINHGIDGGLYAELIQNRSFEDGSRVARHPRSSGSGSARRTAPPRSRG